MMKKTWLIIAAMLVLIALTACSGGNDKAKDTNDVKTNEQKPNTSTNEEKGKNEPVEEEKEALSGTIRISLPNGSNTVWTEVANAYMAKHNDVKVVVDHKPQDGYREWLTAQFAAGTPDVDLVTNNEVASLQQDKKFVDLLPWFERENPYTGKKWKESLDLDAMGINLSGTGSEKNIYNLNFESVQIVWVYNKEIFEAAGVTDVPTTMTELVDAFDKIKAAGYIPLSLEGNSHALWAGKGGWMVRIYADQYMRDYINYSRSQEQDYTYLPEVDEDWTYDLNDTYNDSNSKVTKNPLRQLQAIRDKQGPYKIEGNPAWAAYSENLKKLLSYTPDGFFGLNDEQSYNLFLTGKAATMLGFPAAYWQLPKDFADEEVTGSKGGVKPFEYGFFNMPSMDDDQVLAPARTIHIPIGFYGIVAKDAKQTELMIDFMMYLTSPEGYSVYLAGIEKSTDAALSGAPALRDIELPESMASAFANFEPIGNTEGFESAANSMARGLLDYQPSVQDWVGSFQRYLGDEITTEQYLSDLQANVDKYFEAALKDKKYDLSDIENPDRQPPDRN